MIWRGHKRWLVQRDSLAYQLLLMLRVPLYPARVGTDHLTWVQIGA